MRKEEKQLLKQLCSFKSNEFDEALLKYATPAVLGYLFFNRMSGVAYGTLKKHGLLGKVNREFRNSLKGAYEQNVEKNRNFFWCIQYLNIILSAYKGRYAMLKGAYLCQYYPEGYRTSNDIDLLVLPEDVTEVGKILTSAGFLQGNIRNGEFVPATRKEVMESKMTRGETVPYIKEINLQNMKYLEVDINFSLDYKNGEDHMLRYMLNRTQHKTVPGHYVKTLEDSDFFIHLCSHLYKEATTLPWVEMKRDMSLYKYCDIYLLLSDMSTGDVRQMFQRARKMGMEKVCAFAILQTAALMEVEQADAVLAARKILQKEPEFIHTVISPKEKKIMIYKEKDIRKRFFAENRKALLKEVKEDVKTQNETK